MTLVAVAANPHFVVQVSDRRITAGPTVVSEESNKAIVWTLDGARFLVGYTGIAGTTAMIDTHFLLCKLIQDCAPRAECDPENTIKLFSDELGRVLRTRPRYRGLRMEAKRLTVMFTGLLCDAAGGGVPVQALVTNFQVWGSHDELRARPSFDVLWLQPKLDEAWPTLVQRIGAWNAVPIEHDDATRELLEKGKPPHAVRDRMLAMLPEWATRAHGSVGLQASSVIITADLNAPARTMYHSAVNSITVFGVSQVFTTARECVSFVDPEITADGPNARPLAVPPVDPRRLCPCGSGKHYRDCHSQASPAR